jgi:DNA-binding NarL/FixJ family response regulator
MAAIKIIIVDDHALFRIGVRSSIIFNMPDMQVVGEAESGKGFFALLATTQADIVLLDIVLPDMNGIEIARRLKKDFPDLKILAVSAENSSAIVQSLLKLGIDGFISKRQSDANELGEAIRSVMSGVEYFGKDIAAIISKIYLTKKQTTEITSEFTAREREIIALSREGLMCKEIAERMNITTKTVNNHKANIFEKLGIHNNMEMVQYAMKQGIIKLE